MQQAAVSQLLQLAEAPFRSSMQEAVTEGRLWPVAGRERLGRRASSLDGIDNAHASGLVGHSID